MPEPDAHLFYEGSDLEAMATAKNYAQWVHDAFQLSLQGRVCEVGAGTGSLTELILGSSGVTSLSLCEPSPNLSGYLAERFADEERVTLYSSTLQTAAQQMPLPLNSIIYNNVLEHIEEDLAELELAKDCLRPGGEILILVPALPFLFSEFDASIGHFRRYTRTSLGALLEQAGLETLRLTYLDLLGVIPWYLSMVLLKGGMNIRAVRLYDRLGIPVSRALESLVTPPLGKNLLAVARKPI